MHTEEKDNGFGLTPMQLFKVLRPRQALALAHFLRADIADAAGAAVGEKNNHEGLFSKPQIKGRVTLPQFGKRSPPCRPRPRSRICLPCKSGALT